MRYGNKQINTINSVNPGNPSPIVLRAANVDCVAGETVALGTNNTGADLILQGVTLHCVSGSGISTGPSSVSWTFGPSGGGATSRFNSVDTVDLSETDAIVTSEVCKDGEAISVTVAASAASATAYEADVYLVLLPRV